MSVNKFIFMGRLTKDVEVNNNVGRTSIAVDRYMGKDKENKTDFFNLTAFTEQANHLAKWFKKGSPIYVEGEIHNNNYTDKNGVARYDTQFVVFKSEFLVGSKSEQNIGVASEKTSAPRNDDSPAALDREDDSDPMLNITASDLPF